MKEKKWQDAFPPTPEHFHKRVEATLEGLPRAKEKEKMRIKKRLLAPVIALVALLAIGTGLLATGNIHSITGSSSSLPDYKEVPTQQQLSEDLGYAPNIPAEFSNGYTFESAVIGDQEGQDEYGNAVDKHKFIQIKYTKDNANIYIYAEKWSTAPSTPVTETYDGVDLYYTADMYKFVPPDYELTEQDKADEASGKYIFSYGTDEVEIQTNQSVSWEKDGISYGLLATDSDLTQDDLMAMAKEALN